MMSLQKIFILPPLKGLNLYDNPFLMPPEYAVEMSNFMPPTTTFSVRPGTKFFLEIPGQIKGVMSYHVGASRNHGANWFNSTIDYGASDDLLVKSTLTDGTTKLYRVNLLTKELLYVGDMQNNNYNDDSYLYRHTLFISSGNPNSSMYLYHQTKGLKEFSLGIGNDGHEEVTDIINICGYNEYIFMAQQSSLNIYCVKQQYADILDPLNSTAWKSFDNMFSPHFGSSFSIDGLVQNGGIILKMATLSRTGADTLSSYLTVITDMGEIVMFDGTDPTDTTGEKWHAVGRYQISPPLNRSAFVEMEGDIIIATRNGLVSLRRIVFGQRTDITEALEYRMMSLFSQYQFKIPSITEFVNLYYHPRLRLLMMNVPTDMPMPFDKIVPSYNFNNNKSLVFPQLITTAIYQDVLNFCRTFIYKNGIDYTLVIELDGDYVNNSIRVSFVSYITNENGKWIAKTNIAFGIYLNGIRKSFFSEALVVECPNLSAVEPDAYYLNKVTWDPSLSVTDPEDPEKTIYSYKFPVKPDGSEYIVTNITSDVKKIFKPAETILLSKTNVGDNFARFGGWTRVENFRQLINKTKLGSDDPISISDFFKSQMYKGAPNNQWISFTPNRDQFYSYYADNLLGLGTDAGASISWPKVFIRSLMLEYGSWNHDREGFEYLNATAGSFTDFGTIYIDEYFKVNETVGHSMEFSVVDALQNERAYALNHKAQILSIQPAYPYGDTTKDINEVYMIIRITTDFRRTDITQEYINAYFTINLHLKVEVNKFTYQFRVNDNDVVTYGGYDNVYEDFGGSIDMYIKYDGIEHYTRTAPNGAGSIFNVINSQIAGRLTRLDNSWQSIDDQGRPVQRDTLQVIKTAWENRFNWIVANYVLKDVDPSPEITVDPSDPPVPVQPPAWINAADKQSFGGLRKVSKLMYNFNLSPNGYVFNVDEEGKTLSEWLNNCNAHIGGTELFYTSTWPGIYYKNQIGRVSFLKVFITSLPRFIFDNYQTLTRGPVGSFFSYTIKPKCSYDTIAINYFLSVSFSVISSTWDKTLEKYNLVCNVKVSAHTDTSSVDACGYDATYQISFILDLLDMSLTGVTASVVSVQIKDSGLVASGQIAQWCSPENVAGNWVNNNMDPIWNDLIEKMKVYMPESDNVPFFDRFNYYFAHLKFTALTIPPQNDVEIKEVKDWNDDEIAASETAITNVNLEQIALFHNINIVCNYRSTQYVFDSHFGTWSSFKDINMIKGHEHAPDFYFVIPKDIKYDGSTGKYVYTSSHLCTFNSDQFGDYDPNNVDSLNPINVSYKTVPTSDLGIPNKKILKRMNVFGNPSAFWQTHNPYDTDYPLKFTMFSDFKAGIPIRFIHVYDSSIEQIVLKKYFKGRTLRSLGVAEAKNFWKYYQSENDMISKINIPIIAQVGSRIGLQMDMKTRGAYINIYGFEVFFDVAKSII